MPLSRSLADLQESDFEICTDQTRLQQVLLNLLSNSLKFTKCGGSVRILAKYVRERADLTFQDEFQRLTASPTFDLVLQHGMIEIQVQDTGIGIKEEDQQKLFKLFGFLDSTKELNTRGVGLGLHISKQIVNQFGGDIICKSEWGRGTTFAFLIALNEGQQLVRGIRRIQNPIQKTYIKIVLPSASSLDGEAIIREEDDYSEGDPSS